MEFEELQKRALEIRRCFEAYEKREYGRSWTREEIALGFIGDIGDMAKLLLAHEGVRDIPEAKEKLAHELSDCMWSIIVLAELYGVDLEMGFLKTMDHLQKRLKELEAAADPA